MQHIIIKLPGWHWFFVQPQIYWVAPLLIYFLQFVLLHLFFGKTETAKDRELKATLFIFAPVTVWVSIMYLIYQTGHLLMNGRLAE